MIHWRAKDPSDLPDDNRQVLLLTDTGDTYQGYYDAESDLWEVDSDRGTFRWDRHLFQAWQELPTWEGVT